MSPFVLDCSVEMAWIFPEEATDKTSALRESLVEGFAMVPALWTYEVGNVLIQSARLGRIPPEDWVRVLTDLACLPIEIESGGVSRVWDPVLPLATRWGLSVYDASYLELALRFHLPLATLDKELQRACLAAEVLIL